jgi:hypothetical protein
MAVFASYKDSVLNLPNCFIRLSRIWGSKNEGWNAWADVYAKQGDKEPKTKFHIIVPYVEDENPFVALYNAMVGLSFLQDVKSDNGEIMKEDKPIVAAVVSEQFVTPIVEDIKPQPKPKKLSSKKK